MQLYALQHQQWEEQVSLVAGDEADRAAACSDVQAEAKEGLEIISAAIAAADHPHTTGR